MTRDNVIPLNCYQSRFRSCGKHVAIQTRAICEYSELAERSQFVSSLIRLRRSMNLCMQPIVANSFWIAPA
jgi:hypothetical protein